MMGNCRLVLLSGWLFVATGLVGQTFTERALASGIDHYALDRTGMAGGVAVFDYDNDGWEDIYLTGGEAADVLYRNRGDGTFEDVSYDTRIAGLASLHTMGVVAADLDADGYTDLLLTTAAGDYCHLLLNEGGQHFSDRSVTAGLREVAWNSSATVADYDADGDLDIYVGNYVDYSALPFEEHITAPEPDFLYRNEGGLRFTRVLTIPATEPPQAGCTLATLFSDFDTDGTPDLFVLNDFGDFYTPNRLYRNDQGAFTDISTPTQMRAAMNAMGIAVGDLNGDRQPDYYLTNIGDNRLYLSQPDGSFTEAARTYGVNDGFGMSWGTVLQDFNQDGLLDLYASKGYLYGQDIPQYNRLYLSRDTLLRLDDHSRDVLTPELANKSRGVAYGDLDNNGSLDLIVAGVRFNPDHSARALLYYGREPTGNWLSLKLTGQVSNRSAIGTKATLYTGAGRQYRELTLGGSYLSSSSSYLHFGLGAVEIIDSLVIDWPAPGGREVYFPGEVNTRYAIVEGGHLTTTPAVGYSAATLSFNVYPNPSIGSLSITYPFPTVGIGRLDVFDLRGSLVHQQLIPTASTDVRLDVVLPPGRYLLRIQRGGANSFARVIVR